MIPATNRAWRTAPSPLLAAGHPAVRLMAAMLLVTSAMLASPVVLAGLVAVVAALLHLAGLRWSRVPALLWPWSPIAAVVLAAHAVSATDVAPLWQPTLTGLGRGGATLLRLATALGALVVAGRSLPLRALTEALGWWLRPLRYVGLDVRYLGLTLAVALGTAPRTQAEAARLLACLRLRRPPRRRTPWRALMDRVLVVGPVMDGLARRAETLPLALAGRAGEPAAAPVPPPWPQIGLLGVWVVALVWLA